MAADQQKSIDRDARRLRVAGRAPAEVVAKVRAKLAALLEVGGGTAELGSRHRTIVRSAKGR